MSSFLQDYGNNRMQDFLKGGSVIIVPRAKILEATPTVS